MAPDQSSLWRELIKVGSASASRGGALSISRTRGARDLASNQSGPLDDTARLAGHGDSGPSLASGGWLPSRSAPVVVCTCWRNLFLMITNERHGD